MSTRSYSKHVPDFRLVTHYAESGRSAVHAMNPWTKAVLLALVVAFATVLVDIYLLAMMFAVTVLFYAAGRLPIRVLIGWYALPVSFVVTLAIMFVFTEPGNEVAGLDLGWFRIAVTDHGLELLIKLLLRALAVVTFSLTVFMTTRYSHVAHMAHRVLPGPIATVFLLSYRFMYVSSDEVTDVVDAMNTRSGSLARGIVRQTRMYAGIFGISFVHAFERAEDIAKAMESRGFTGQFPVSEHIPGPTWRGYALIALVLVCLGVVTYSRYFDRQLIGWW